jgi:adenylate kinase
VTTTRGPRLVLLGKQGSGKGTQAENLAGHYRITHLSTGDLFRAAAEAGTPRGLEAKQYMDRGELVPDETVIGVVEESFERDNTPSRGFILDGFPRTQPQALELTRILGHRTLDVVIDLEVSDDVALQRMLARGREDDTRETIARRLELYREETEPLCDYYRDLGLLAVIDGSGEIDDITGRVVAVVDEHLDPARS